MQKGDTAVGNVMKRDATKSQGSIFTHDLIRTRKFINVMSFPGIIHRQGLALLNINILCHNLSVDCCVCIPSILYITCCLFCTCFIPVTLTTTCNIPYV